MPRGKPSTSENSTVSEATAPLDEEPKSKFGAVVTLVKPLQTGENMSVDDTFAPEAPELAKDEAGAAARPKKTGTRPKVGRSSGTRKKKAAGGDGAAEKKPGRPRRKTEAKETAPASVEAETAGEIASATESQVKSEPVFTLSPDTNAAEPALEKKLVALLPDETSGTAIAEQLETSWAHQEQPEDWNAEQRARPHSFKTILFAVFIFVLINVGLMMAFSASHKPKAASPALAAKSEVKQLPPIPSAAPPAMVAAPMPAPQAAAPVPVFAPVPFKADAPQPLQARQLPPVPVSGPVTTKAPAISPVGISTLPLANPATPDQAASVSPVNPAPAARAQAQLISSSPTEAKPEKAASSQELLSILDKN